MYVTHIASACLWSMTCACILAGTCTVMHISQHGCHHALICMHRLDPPIKNYNCGQKLDATYNQLSLTGLVSFIWWVEKRNNAKPSLWKCAMVLFQKTLPEDSNTIRCCADEDTIQYVSLHIYIYNSSHTTLQQHAKTFEQSHIPTSLQHAKDLH